MLTRTVYPFKVSVVGCCGWHWQMVRTHTTNTIEDNMDFHPKEPRWVVKGKRIEFIVTV